MKGYLKFMEPRMIECTALKGYGDHQTSTEKKQVTISRHDGRDLCYDSKSRK